MANPLDTARTLARRPSVRASGLALLVLGGLAGALPLLETPGYELGELAALLAVLLAPFAGIAAARLELARPAPSPLAATSAAALVSGGLVLALVAGAMARAALGPCAVLGRAAAFVPLLAIPSIVLGSALAVAAAFAGRGRRARAAALYVAGALASLAVSLVLSPASGYRGPAAFAFDPLLGAWPGPIYDESVVPDLRALLFRAAALAAGIAIAALAEAAVRRPRADARAARPLALAVAAVAAAVLCHVALEVRGLSGSRGALARALGGRREGPRCTLVLPREKATAAADALLAECEFQVADVARALGIPPPRVTGYVYRSAEEKRRLVGASATEYAKPWLREIHLVDAPPPHPVLRHELVHAVAADVAGGLLGVPARRGVLVSAGLVEGLAAALETPRGRWTVHEWSRAAKELRLLPDVARIAGPTGFWGEAPARAYTAAGSFVAFLLERHGAAKVREAYRTGDVAAALGVPLRTLADEWSRFLDEVPVTPGLLAAARPRLARQSLFARPCARETAGLEARAAAAAAAGRVADACALYDAAAARTGAAAARKAAGDLKARAGDLAGADAAYREAAARAAEDDRALRAALAAAEGDLAWRRGELAAAAAAWSASLATGPDRAEARLLEAKIVAVSDPVLGPVARPLLLGDGDPAPALERVGREDRPLAAYLSGRALVARGEAPRAVPALERAVQGRLQGSLAREAALLLGGARCAAGEREAGIATLRPLAGSDATAADRARAEEALRRCGVP